MGKVTIELNIPDDVVRRIDLDTVRRIVERDRNRVRGEKTPWKVSRDKSERAPS